MAVSKLVKFLFVENLEADGIRHLAEGLQAYVELSRDWNGRIDTAYPLIVAFSREAVEARTVEGYQAKGWHILHTDPEEATMDGTDGFGAGCHVVGAGCGR
ncbi:YqcI/YcgG family protein [Arthrobacter sp. 24S4-2]|uniref:YqcI/YcgG family protein n=1 Tax=Arthrobacter sp. 24S4-2 TaxID=2575374 RepID=UPI001C304464|nr:YqcI/YcgG family protein [Arthrobacter sp. 24S4-2]